MFLKKLNDVIKLSKNWIIINNLMFNTRNYILKCLYSQFLLKK